MGFFDDFGKKISSAGQEAIAKTKELADVAKINSSISDEENKIKTAYSEIGKKYIFHAKSYLYKKYFENHSEDSEEDYEAQIAVIKEAMEKIKAYEQQIVEIKGVVKCPNCGAENSKTAAFCATCGTAMPVPVTESVEATEQNVVEKKCPNCGEVINDGAAFCAKCGTKIEEEQ